MCLGLCATATLCQSSLPCCPLIRAEEIQTTPAAAADPSAVPSLLLFSFPLVLNLSPIYEAFLCGCVTRVKAKTQREREREREKERERVNETEREGEVCLAGFSCPTVRSYFSVPASQFAGSRLIVGLLGSFRHAWPALISPVCCNTPPPNNPEHH